MTLHRTLLLAALAAPISFCTPAHADEVIWINDNSGNLVGQVARTGDVYWLYDGHGTPQGTALVTGASSRTALPPVAPFVEPSRQPRRPPPKRWKLDDEVLDLWD